MSYLNFLLPYLDFDDDVSTISGFIVLTFLTEVD